MLKFKIFFATLLTFLIAACNPPKLAGSRLRSSASSSASVSLLPTTDGSSQLTFVHNHPDAGPDNYKMTSLTVSAPAVSSAVNIDGTSTRLALAPLKFDINMVATASPRKLTCLAPGIPMGTSSIGCTLEGGSSDGADSEKSADKEIVKYITTKNTDISTALKGVKATIFAGTDLPAGVVAHWQQLEKDAKLGGGMNGAADAIAAEIRAWNTGLDFEAEKVAAVLVNVYREGSAPTDASTTGSSKNPDKEIASYIVKQKAGIAEALYFVKTNIINAELPSAVVSRWSGLEKDVKSYNGDVEATTRQIEVWNIDLGYSAEAVAAALSPNYK